MLTLRNVLVVGLNANLNGTLTEALSGRYSLCFAVDSQQANDMFDAGEKCSAIIIASPEDINETLTRVSLDETTAATPVIVVSETEDDTVQAAALAAGATDFCVLNDTKIFIQKLNNIIKLAETATAFSSVNRDPLTGLYSRAGFFKKAAEMIAREETGHFVLSCLDVDGFKAINDLYGSEIGDKVLRQIGDVFKNGICKIGGIASRISADTFGVLFPKQWIESAYIAEMWRQASVLDGTLAPINYTVGRYFIEDKSLSIEAMFDRSMMAESSVKAQYNCNVAVYDESMRNKMLLEQQIILEMVPALNDGQFEVWYQPQFNHNTGAIIGAEALVRWRHPTRGLISPADFIPVFEKNGFIYELDKFVWEQSCRDLRRSLDEGNNPMPISVNVSRCDVVKEDFFEAITNFVQKFELSPSMLRLEITESAFSKDPTRIIAVVEKLIAAGFTVEIDDFGSGYSSLNTLKDVPAQIIKLDMRFLEGRNNGSRGGNIIESVVRMAKWLGMSVIAEGVETKPQADYLQSIGCNYIQGFLYARPMPATDYEKMAATAGQEQHLLRLSTVENLNTDAFWDPDSVDTLIFNSYVGAAGIVEYYDNELELIRCNAKLAQIVGGNTAEVKKLVNFKSLSEESKKTIKELTSADITDNIEKDIDVCTPTPDGVKYLHITMRVIATTGSRSLLYCLVDDTTKETLSTKKLAALNADYRKLMNDTPGGFCRLKVYNGGKIVTEYVNEGLCQIRGMTSEQIMEKERHDALSFIHPDDLTMVRSKLHMLTRAGQVSNVCYRIKNGQGKYIWLMNFGRLSQNEDGEMCYNIYSASLSEIEDNRFSLRDAMPFLLETIMESSNDLSFAKDTDFKYMCCSKPFAKMVGLTEAAEVVGKTDYDLFDKALADKFREDDIQLVASGKAMVGMLEEIPSTDGFAHYADTSKYLLHDALGAFIGLYGVARDITDARVDRDNLKMLTDNIPGGLATFEIKPDKTSRLIWYNEGFFASSGYSAEEYAEIAKGDALTIVHPDDREKVLAAASAIETEIGKTFGGSFRLLQRDGSYRSFTLKGKVSDIRHGTLLISVLKLEN